MKVSLHFFRKNTSAIEQVFQTAPI